METATLVAAGWTSGINAYLTVLVLGVAGRAGWADTPASLQTTKVLILAAVLFAIEFVVDKIPLADTAWDVLHTAIRPSVAAAVGAATAGATLGQPQASLLAASLALVAHLSKTTTRMAINASPEPFSNAIASFSEDGIVAVLVVLALARPRLAAALALLAMVAFAVVGVALFTVARKGFGALRQRLGGTRPAGA